MRFLAGQLCASYLSLSLPLSLSHTHTHALSHSLSPSLSLTPSLHHSLSLPLSITLSHSLSLSLSLPLYISLFLSPTLTFSLKQHSRFRLTRFANVSNLNFLLRLYFDVRLWCFHNIYLRFFHIYAFSHVRNVQN